MWGFHASAVPCNRDSLRVIQLRQSSKNGPNQANRVEGGHFWRIPFIRVFAQFHSKINIFESSLQSPEQSWMLHWDEQLCWTCEPIHSPFLGRKSKAIKLTIFIICCCGKARKQPSQACVICLQLREKPSLFPPGHDICCSAIYFWTAIRKPHANIHHFAVRKWRIQLIFMWLNFHFLPFIPNYLSKNPHFSA